MINASRQNMQLPCLRHNVVEGKPCVPSSRTQFQPQFTGKVCGSRYRKTKNLP